MAGGRSQNNNNNNGAFQAFTGKGVSLAWEIKNELVIFGNYWFILKSRKHFLWCETNNLQINEFRDAIIDIILYNMGESYIF